IVGVMGSAKSAPDWAEAFGAALAREGWHLLTGGGLGVMEAVSRGFVRSDFPGRGVCLGILPEASDRYPNQWVEIPIRTPLGRFDPVDPERITRNHLNILTSTAVVALPGNQGTRNECELALGYGRPLLYLGPPAAFEGFPASPRVDTIDPAIAWLRACLGRAGS
ncbi:MAG: DNA-binding protein, partial [Candidatus Eremiobacterota bacterium]